MAEEKKLKRAEKVLAEADQLLEKGRLGPATEKYLQACRLNPDYIQQIQDKPNLSAKFHFRMGDELQKQRQVEAAIVSYEKAIANKDPDAPANFTPRLYLKLGDAQNREGSIEEAITSYQKVIELDPNAFQAHNRLGNAFEKKEQLDEAFKYYQKASQLKPDVPQPYRQLGNVLLKQGKDNEALEYYRKAIAV